MSNVALKIGLLLAVTLGLLSPGFAANTCGDGRRAGTEECDDGNAVSGDGCSWDCRVEHGYSCNKKTPSQCSVVCPDYPLPEDIWARECRECKVDLRSVPYGEMAEDPTLLEQLRQTDEAIESARIEDDIASLTYAVVHDQELLWFRGHGYTDASRPEASLPDIDTIYRLGSITKVFTTLGMLLLQQDGTLPSIDGLVSDVVPELQMHDTWETPRSGLTWRHLASYTSGISRECPCGPLVFTQNATVWCDGLSFDDMIPRLNEEYTHHPRGTHPQYSNCGFTVLGRGLERVTGMPYERFTTERIIEPLGLSATHFWPSLSDEPHVARGYNLLLEDLMLENAEGQLFSSTRDMVEFLKFLMRWYEPANAAEGQILDGATIREWLRPDYLEYDGTGGGGMTWKIETHYDNMLVGKAGGMAGYSAYIGIVPDLKIGFVIMENSEGGDYDRTRGLLSKLMFPALRAYEERHQINPSIPLDTSEYEGAWEYDLDGYLIDMTIYRQDGLLFADSEAWYSLRYILEYIGDDKFRTVEHSTFGAPYATCLMFEVASDTGEVFHFKRDANGSIRGFYMEGATHYGDVFTRVGSAPAARNHVPAQGALSPLAQRTLNAINSKRSK